MGKIHIFQTDDWVVVYVNDKLYADGHSLLPIDWIRAGMMVGSDGEVFHKWLSEKQFVKLGLDIPPKELSGVVRQWLWGVKND